MTKKTNRFVRENFLLYSINITTCQVYFVALDSSPSEWHGGSLVMGGAVSVICEACYTTFGSFILIVGGLGGGAAMAESSKSVG